MGGRRNVSGDLSRVSRGGGVRVARLPERVGSNAARGSGAGAKAVRRTAASADAAPQVTIYDSVWDALGDNAAQAANMKARAELMRTLQMLVRQTGWTQVEAARRCGITQPRMNDLLRGRISRFSLDALVNIAAASGRQVRIVLEVA
jgi:predicted XRE-type DNA-binding protein